MAARPGAPELSPPELSPPELSVPELSVPELSVVVPVHDEAANIAPLIAEIDAALGGRIEFEIVYVDDGSGDASAEELARARRRHPRLKVLRHRAQCGQSAALGTGIAAARAEWIATLDGDGQNDPADILSLVEARDESGDPNLRMIAGVRRKRRDSPLRRLSSRIANAVRRRVLRDATTDTGCGLKLFRREAYLALPAFDHMHRFLPALIKRGGGAVLEVPVGHRPRRAGASHYGMLNRAWIGLVDMLGVAWLQRRMKYPVVEEMDES
ncbi:MAG: glycosyltransferase family 2 protein [Proteobacteria bacterium]|nr:glycosyltransferase family 2 protein [Pseudomonadota bacterium]